MSYLGRCGRRRRQRDRDGLSLSYLPGFVSLMQWMNHSLINSCRRVELILEPAQFKETGRGLKCKKRVLPGDVIVSIPAPFLITPDTVLKSSLGALIIRSGLQFSPQQLLTMFLTLELYKGDQSKWKPYMESLPQVYTIPVYFSEEELNLLSPRVKDLSLKARERFEKACEKIRSFVTVYAGDLVEAFSRDTLQWAWCSVNTRSVYLKTNSHPSIMLDPEECHVAMAPFLDLLNHKDTAKISAGLVEDGSSYDIVSFDKYEKHSQVFISYGAHDNVKLLVEYGFTLPHNSNNSYVFNLDTVCQHCAPEKHGKALWRKQEILKQAGFDRQLVCTQEGVSWSLMTSIKILILSWDDLSLWKQLVQSGILSEENTHQAYDKAHSLLRDALLKCQRHLRLVTESPPTPHKDLILSLAQDDVNILKLSLSLLNDQREFVS